MWRSAADLGGGIWIGDQHNRHVTLDRCIIAGSTNGPAIDRLGSTGTAQMSCCDLWGNAGGDWVGFIADQFGVNGNISAYPLFCDPNAVELTIREDSLCAQGAGCGLIGAWPVGCEVQASAAFPMDFRADPIRILPNPSSGPVQIEWASPLASGRDLAPIGVYDVRGRLVKDLRANEDGVLRWDGAETDGRPVSSGIYFVSFRSGSDLISRRIVRAR